LKTLEGAVMPVSKDPYLKRMNLYSKFAIFAGFVAVAMVFNNPFSQLPILLICLALCMAAGIKVKALLNTVKTVVSIFMILLVFSALIYNINSAHHEIAKQVYFVFFKTSFMTVSLTSGGILMGLNFIIKMMIMILAANLFSQTTTVEEMLFGLNRIGLPYQIGLMLSISLRFIPTLTKEVEQIQQAQKSRGASTKRNKKGGKRAVVQGIIPLFVPMIVSSMRRSDTMAMSMTSRGYGFSNKRTQLFDIKFRFAQLLFCLADICVVAACIYIKRKYGIGVL